MLVGGKAATKARGNIPKSKAATDIPAKLVQYCDQKAMASNL